MAGIYQILNTLGGHHYIGSAVDVAIRWRHHRKRLRGGYHSNVHLQRAWNRDGESAFDFRTLLICKPEHLLMYEQICLDGLKPEYNIRTTAASNLGLKHSDVAIEKIRVARRARPGIPHTQDARARISAAGFGRRHTLATKAKMRCAALLRWHGPKATS